MASRSVLVVGAGGLLGSGVLCALRRRERDVQRVSVPWPDPAAATGALLAAAHEVHSRSDGDWTLIWCAGAGVVGATPDLLAAEITTLARFVDGLAAPGGPRPRLAFFASSAGAIYAGSADPPFTEDSLPRPLGAYGESKLGSEGESKLGSEGEFGRLAPLTRVLIGRISNLYGPGQDLSKNQGLITRLCLSYLVREPLGVYVSLDTIRDYLYVDDCAELICDCLERLRSASDDETSRPVMKILAANRPASIALVLGECRRAFGRKVLVQLASSDLATRQSRDLRLRSLVWPELDRRPTTPLIHGIHLTVEDLRAQLDARARAFGFR